MIRADYLMKNQLNNDNILVFLEKESDDIYFCKSLIVEKKTDYSKNQPNWTLLFKKKIDSISGVEIVLYNRIN